MIDAGRMREEHQPHVDNKDVERKLMFLVGGALAILVALKIGLHKRVMP